MLSEDLDVYLEEFGVPCSCGPVTFLGIKDEPDVDLTLGGGHAQSTMYTLLVKTAVVTAAGIKSGSAITVDGVPYIARNPVRQDDGAFTRIPLSKG